MKNKFKFLAAAAVAAAMTLAGCGSADDAAETTDDTEKTTQTEKTPEPAAPATEEYSTDLTAGFYTAGTDIPVGSYDLTLVSGQGNVYSGPDAGINEIFGTDKDLGCVSSYNGVKLEQGDVLSISGNVKITAASKAAEVKEMKARTEDTDNVVTLTPGNYTAGTDFPAGTYDITATDGRGNVISDDPEGFTNDVNEIMTPTPDDSGLEEISEFQNAPFPENTTLEVRDVTVNLTPVSE